MMMMMMMMITEKAAAATVVLQLYATGRLKWDDGKWTLCDQCDR